VAPSSFQGAPILDRTAHEESGRRVVPDRLRRLAIELFTALRAASFDGVGVSRETYGESETEAMEIIAGAAAREGLGVEWDAARNLIVSLPGRNPELPAVATGSHLDSVPVGGNYDGAAGVVAGLIALVAARRSGPPARTMRLYALRGEESAWFDGPCYFGSRALFGQLGEADFAARHRSGEKTLADCMREAGADMAALRGGAPLIDPSTLACWIELHIEQGPVLVALDKPVGLVTGIRGNVRHRKAVCHGEAAHSGAVPRWLRHDAVLAMSDLLVRLDEHWRVLLEWGEDLVLTAGIVATNPREHALSRVPGEVSFALEYRSQDMKTLGSFGKLIESECAQVASRRGVRFELGPSTLTDPARMSPKITDLLQETCAELGIAPEIMPSGAGHDTSIFANAGVPSGMIFVRNDNGSHNPREAMDYEDFFLASAILARALEAAADRTPETKP
jgi:N-carbamoyl-L-amino-acid hydrolase